MRINKKIAILLVFSMVGLGLPTLSDTDLPELPSTDAIIKDLQTEESNIQKTTQEIIEEKQPLTEEENTSAEEKQPLTEEENTSADEKSLDEQVTEETESTDDIIQNDKKETKQEKIDPVRIEVSSQRIPAGTSFAVKLNNSINSVSAEIGDQFNTSLVNDIIINDNIVLPAGSVIRGTIGKIQKSGLCFKEARIMLVFDHVVTPIGKQVPIYAYVTNNEKVNYAGYFVGGTSYEKVIKEDIQKSKSLIVNSTNWGLETGKKYLSGAPVVLTAPVGAIGGALGGSGYLVGKSIYNIFNKGANVFIDKDTILNITLSRDLDVPVN